MEHILYVLMVMILNPNGMDTQVVKSHIRPQDCYSQLGAAAKENKIELKEGATGFWIDKNAWVSCVPVKHAMIW